MMNCLFVEFECVSLPPPDKYNNATCRNPTTTVPAIVDSQLSGDWYIVRGFNPLYDCFDCQVSSFAAKDGIVNYHALFNMIASNGTEIWMTSDIHGDDLATPGVISFDGMDNGLPDHQNWFVMHLDDDTFVAYYCGIVLSWHYEGFLVLSKTTTVNPDREVDIQRIMADLEISESDMCFLDPATECAAVPSLFS
jgi:hypothetical protein